VICSANARRRRRKRRRRRIRRRRRRSGSAKNYYRTAGPARFTQHCLPK